MDEFTPAEQARLADYFAQELSPDDIAQVEQWIDQVPERRRLVDELQRMRRIARPASAMLVPDLPLRAETLSRKFREIRAQERMSQVSPRVPSVGRGERTSRWFRHPVFSRPVWPTMGAAIASLLFVFVGWQLLGARSTSPSSTVMSVYTTGNGERATITLPDGSTILLNVASRVSVPTNYGDGNRTVQLSGEALFTVVHHNRTPFTVVSGTSTTRVLGTSFIVRQYATDTATTIAVRDGKVAVGSTIVPKSQQLVIGPRGAGVLQPLDFNLFGFEAGVLKLNRMSFADAIPELNRWYDVDIRIVDQTLGQEMIEGQFVRGAELAESLRWMTGFRVVRDGRVLTLYRR